MKINDGVKEWIKTGKNKLRRKLRRTEEVVPGGFLMIYNPNYPHEETLHELQVMKTLTKGMYFAINFDFMSNAEQEINKTCCDDPVDS